jgi:methyl-galactoside transport system substrate-binding protein
MQYIMIHGPLSHPHASIRKEKTVEAITGAGITVDNLSEIDGKWGLDDASKASIKTFLESNKGQKVEAIICGNDGMALGMVEVLNEIPYFSDKKIPIVGIDGTKDAIEAINSGDMLGTVLQDFEKIGEKTFDVCYALGVGESINNPGGGKCIVIPSMKITKD